MQETLAPQPKEMSEKRTRFRWLVAAMFFLVYMIAGADRANIGVVVPFIRKSYHLTNTDIGAMTSLFISRMPSFKFLLGSFSVSTVCESYSHCRLF